MIFVDLFVHSLYNDMDFHNPLGESWSINQHRWLSQWTWTTEVSSPRFIGNMGDISQGILRLGIRRARRASLWSSKTPQYRGPNLWLLDQISKNFTTWTQWVLQALYLWLVTSCDYITPPEERDPDHILEIKLIKVKKVPSTGHRGWCALVRKRWKAAGRKPWFLLNLLYAKETWRKSSEFFDFSSVFTVVWFLWCEVWGGLLQANSSSTMTVTSGRNAFAQHGAYLGSFGKSLLHLGVDGARPARPKGDRIRSAHPFRGNAAVVSWTEDGLVGNGRILVGLCVYI